MANDGMETLPPDSPLPTLGAGRYKLAATLGDGGMASVYRAWDSRLRVWRAIKILLPEYSRRKKLRRRFQNEAETMARIQHRHVVSVFDVGVDEAVPYIVMEVALGGCLIDWVHRHGPMPPRMAVDVIIQVCKGIGAAHDIGVIHRDIKPHNVLITHRGVCMVTDFGIAQMDEGASMTKTGSVMGTLGYMAPEQRTDAKNVDVRADVYGIGATLYKLLTGGAVADLFLAEHDATMLDGVPDGLAPVLLKATRYKPADRHGSVADLAKALHAARKDLPATPASTPSLVMKFEEDLDEELTPVSEATFPEIAEALAPSVSEDATLEPTPSLAPTSATDGKVMPYFMPTPDSAATSRKDAEENTELPDYIDKSSLGEVETGFEVSIDDATRKRIRAARARAIAEGQIDSDGNPITEETSEGEEEQGLDLAVNFVDLVWSILGSLLHGLRKPLWSFAVPLIGGCLVGSFVVGLAAWEVKEAQGHAVTSQWAFYSALESEQRIIDDFDELGGNRAVLEQLYLEFQETLEEPERMEAAMRYLQQVESHTKRHLSSQAVSITETHKRQMASQRWKKIAATYKTYSQAMLSWEHVADSSRGRLAVQLGVASEP